MKFRSPGEEMEKGFLKSGCGVIFRQCIDQMFNIL